MRRDPEYSVPTLSAVVTVHMPARALPDASLVFFCPNCKAKFGMWAAVVNTEPLADSGRCVRGHAYTIERSNNEFSAVFTR